ncbi:transcription initiation factor IIF subunit alpha [Elsinoe australis]|uniref:Transcription initiation factor IIF subunit alpha n=1 Tax=Elsinoe australis TaxID=40998 RepID=A0A4U7B337_9PEZI|nr:transcription initiation factor IIF subunit alpha [Elsinoe australis]
MSASPAGPPSGPPSTTPNGAPPGAMQRRRAMANPLVQKKKPAQKKVDPTRKPGQNGAVGAVNGKPAPVAQPPVQKPDPDDDPSTFTEYPLVATKKSIMQNLRHHAMRLNSDHEVNPYDPSQFTRPLRLHRRYPRDQKTELMPENGIDDKEREKEEIRKAERQAQKEANQAQIAPTDKGQQQKKRPQFKKKVEDVYYPQDTPAAQKRAKLRYEEGRPWHLEDFDSKNTWIGTYEEPLSETHAMLVLDTNGSFRMVPLEKWYRFQPTGRYKTMDLDEAEKHMANKIKSSRWFIENAMTDDQRKRIEAERQSRLMKGRVGMRGERSGPRKGGDDEDAEVPEFAEDADEIDFDAEDEFQDDDEGKLFLGEEEDVKESEKKIRQEMLGANIFAGTGVKEEKDWDEEEENEKKKADDERRRQKKLRRALVKNERKFEYESESDHPYSESSEDDENELTKDEEIKKEGEEKNVNGDKPMSGTSSVGTNTPSGRTEKHGDPSRIHKHAGASLKRPGSPNLSEASGSESSRKRIKKEANGQFPRPMSPNMEGSASAFRRRGAGSGSDTEASGNERSRPRIKISASRDGSPGVSAPSSRPGSPPPRSASAVPSVPGVPSADEVRAAIPPQGITITDLIRKFKNVMPKTKEANTAFIAIVKSVGKNSPADKTLLVRK